MPECKITPNGYEPTMEREELRSLLWNFYKYKIMRSINSFVKDHPELSDKSEYTDWIREEFYDRNLGEMIIDLIGR